MKELILQSNLPVINGNFDEVKQQLLQELKAFDLIVDADSIKEAKKMATQINKVSGNIDSLRKKTVSELSAPINLFVEQTRELIALCQESRQKLLSQVKVFEDKQREECKRLLDMELIVTYKKYAVRDEFQSVVVDDLAILSNLNKSGIAKKAVDAIDERVLERKNFQEKIDTRLLTLEGECFKAGLDAPLTRENVSHFLMVPSDEVYNNKLESLIANEKTRIELMNERLRERAAEQDTAESVEEDVEIQQPTQEVKQYQQPQQQSSSVLKHMKNAQEFAPKKKKLLVTATFEIEVKENMNEDAIEQLLLKKFNDSKEFKTTPAVNVSRIH